MSRTWQQTLWAGLLGGVLAGGGDALAMLAAALTRPSLSDAVALGSVAGALLGTTMATLALLVHAVAVPVAARVQRISAAALVAMTVAAPLLVYDGFAMFAGVRASRVVGHQEISIALILLMLPLVALAGSLWQRLLAHLEGRGGVSVAVGLGLVAAAAALATVLVLALNASVAKRKAEAMQTSVRVVDLDESTVDPAVWGKNFPLQYDGYRSTVDQQRTRYGGSEAIPRTPMGLVRIGMDSVRYLL